MIALLLALSGEPMCLPLPELTPVAARRIPIEQRRGYATSRYSEVVEVALPTPTPAKEK